jgi:uncharacterized protein (TIGR03089 family)
MTPNPPTVIAAFATMSGSDPTRPLITFYDDATGERLDLSGATLANWVAKTANLLVDGHGLAPGDVAAVALPPHWLTAAVLLGCWSAGLVVAASAGDVGFVAGGARVDAADTYAVSLAPLAAPFQPGPPPGTLDYVVAVRSYGDRFTPRVAPGDMASDDGTTHAQLVDAANPVPGSRVLIDADRTSDPRQWLVAPLVARVSIVLCANLDPSRLPARLDTEHAVALP